MVLLMFAYHHEIVAVAFLIPAHQLELLNERFVQHRLEFHLFNIGVLLHETSTELCKEALSSVTLEQFDSFHNQLALHSPPFQLRSSFGERDVLGRPH